MKFNIPHSYVLIFLIILAVTLMTYFVPAGEYNRVIDTETGIERVASETFHLIEKSPVTFFDMFKAIYRGMVETTEIIFFVFIIGGVFNIIMATGIIHQGIKALLKSLKGKEKLIIPIMVFVFSLAGAVLGVLEEILPFYPMIITLAVLLGFDTLTGTSMALLGVSVGFTAGFLNPFSVAIAQGMAELPVFSGMIFRIIFYLVIVITTILYIYRYASKISANPELSITYEKDKKIDYNLDSVPPFSRKHLHVLIVILMGYSYLIYGIIGRTFHIAEIVSVFLMLGLAVGLVGRMKASSIANKFISGAANLVEGALIIGLARAIKIIMEQGRILDTIIYSLASFIKGVHPILNGISMFLVQIVLDFFIPSASGQAAATMPIMVPLSDIVGLTRQTVVLAYQLGDGFMNVIGPTTGYFMAALALSGLTWSKWARWMFPLFIIWCIEGAIFIGIAVLISYGPF